jgi:hypothetical protein
VSLWLPAFLCFKDNNRVKDEMMKEDDPEDKEDEQQMKERIIFVI